MFWKKKIWINSWNFIEILPSLRKEAVEVIEASEIMRTVKVIEATEVFRTTQILKINNIVAIITLFRC